MEDKHLSVAVFARTAAYGWYGKLFGDDFGNFVRYGFKHNGETAGFFKHEGFLKQFFSAFCRACLGFETAEHGGALRCQPQMPHNGNARIGKGFYLREHGFAPFELHGSRSCFSKNFSGAFKGLADAYFIAHKRHVRHNERVRSIFAHDFRVINHIAEGDSVGVVIALHGHAQGISDQNHVDTGFFRNFGAGSVIGGNHGQFFCIFAFFNIEDSFFAHIHTLFYGFM